MRGNAMVVLGLKRAGLGHPRHLVQRQERTAGRDTGPGALSIRSEWLDPPAIGPFLINAQRKHASEQEIPT
jgi:hypothetical protein